MKKKKRIWESGKRKLYVSLYFIKWCCWIIFVKTKVTVLTVKLLCKNVTVLQLQVIVKSN